MPEKTVVVTGCSSGIGAAAARCLTEAGMTVIGVDRRPPEGRDDVAQFYEVDLGERSSIDVFANALGRAHSRIDGLCTIAGVPGTAPTDVVARVNYLGIRHLTTHVARHMVRGSSIAHATSIAGIAWPERLSLHLALAHTPSFEAGEQWVRDHPVDHAACYPYFKEALIVWARLTSTAFIPHGIRVNCVSPGPVSTPILADFRASLGEERVTADIDRVGRAGEPDDVASVFRFLMSRESSWINGADVPVDGGLAAATLSERSA